MKKGLLWLFMFIFLIPLVYARFFSNVGFGGNLEYLYYDYYQFIDFIVYFLIFGSLIKTVFEEKFGENANTLSIGMGIALALGLSLYEFYNNWNLLMLWPVAAGILALVILLKLYTEVSQHDLSFWKVLSLVYIIGFVIVWFYYRIQFRVWFDGFFWNIIAFGLLIGALIKFVRRE